MNNFKKRIKYKLNIILTIIGNLTEENKKLKEENKELLDNIDMLNKRQLWRYGIHDEYDHRDMRIERYGDKEIW